MSIVSDSNISIVTLFGDVVNSIRKHGVITAKSPILGPYVKGIKLITQNTLSNNDVVKIGGVDYVVEKVTPTEFSIVYSGIDFPFTTWAAKAPYYIHGHMLEVANRLTKLDDSTQLYNFQKYPLIILVQDFPERRDRVKPVTATLRILLVTKTERELLSEQRYAASFIPVLYPLYGDLLRALKASKVFGGNMQHTKTDRLFWGTQMAQSNGANILNDHIDAIELSDFEVTINSQC